MTGTTRPATLRLAALLAGTGVVYTLTMGHVDPLRLAVAALTGAALALGVAPLMRGAGLR